MDHYSILDPLPPEKEHGTVPSESTAEAGEESSQAVPEVSEPAAEPERVLAEAEPAKAAPEPPAAAPSAAWPQEEEAGSDLGAKLQAVAQKAQYISNASGAAIALREGGEMVCRAASGSSAPDRGARLQVKSGLTAECLRSGELLTCDNVMSDPRVDRESCKRLGIECIIIAPIRRAGALAGVLELFSSHAYSFQERDVQTVRALAEEIGKMLEQGEEPAIPLEDSSLPAPEDPEEGGCSSCGAPISAGIVFCPECGALQEEKPAKEPPDRGWKSRLQGRRLLVPSVFVAMALAVAVAPIPQHSTGAARTAMRQVPARAAGASAALKPVNAEDAKSSATAGAPTNDTSTDNDKNPSIASSVKQLLGGVSSDFSKLLPVNEKPEPPSNGDPNLRVWVDTRKGFYYCPGEDQYGHTPKGSYMTQKEAESNYYIPALIKPCM